MALSPLLPLNYALSGNTFNLAKSGQELCRLWHIFYGLLIGCPPPNPNIKVVYRDSSRHSSGGAIHFRYYDVTSCDVTFGHVTSGSHATFGHEQWYILYIKLMIVVRDRCKSNKQCNGDVVACGGHFTATIKTRYLVVFVLLIFVVFCVQLCFFALFCLSSSCVFVCTVLPVSL
jgi:hypothetical protein